MKRAILIIAVVTTGLSGCSGSGYGPKCDERTWERATLFLLTAGMTELIREIELDCPPYQNMSTETLRLRAAELKEEGDAAEQFNVGLALRYRGEIELGYRLVCLSAHQGFQDAQNWMARRYHFGFPPVEADLVQAYKWYQIAFYGADYADKKRAELTPKMTPAEIAEAERLVAEWEPNPAECEVIEAQSEN